MEATFAAPTAWPGVLSWSPPGIRPAGADLNDQQRVATPGRAIADGSDYLVIGRPIRDAQDPEACINAIQREIGPVTGMNTGMTQRQEALNGHQSHQNFMRKHMLIDLLRSRRSLRRFTDQPIEQEKLDLLLEAALRSPSSKGFNPWEFVVVRDKDRIQALSKAKSHGATFLAGAPLVIVVCADSSKSDVWIEDASIATLLVHLEAADLGLGSCWVQLPPARTRRWNSLAGVYA